MKKQCEWNFNKWNCIEFYSNFLRLHVKLIFPVFNYLNDSIIVKFWNYKNFRWLRYVLKNILE